MMDLLVRQDSVEPMRFRSPREVRHRIRDDVGGEEERQEGPEVRGCWRGYLHEAGGDVRNVQ